MNNNLPANRIPTSLATSLNKRRDVEEHLTLAQATATNQSQTRSEANSCSAEDLLHSGAYKNSQAEKQKVLDETRHKRLEAYMSLDSKTVAQTRGWRIRSAYRMVSYMSRICGGLQGPMMLADLLHSRFNPDPSLYPFNPPTSTEVYGTQYIIETISQLQDRPESYTIDTENGTMPCGFMYLPPPIPDQYFPGSDPRTIPYIRHSEPANYDPEDDVPLGIWLDAYSHLSSMLRIHDGTQDEPHAGVFGTVGMFSPQSARLLWPTRDELLMYEQELMLRIFDYLCGGTPDGPDGRKMGNSVQAVEEYVIWALGYGRVEAVMLVKTALRYGTGVYESDVDMAKVRELKSLEIISDKAGAGDDPRAQIAARKQYQLVAGLTKDSSTEESEQFRNLAGKALQDEDPEYLD